MYTGRKIKGEACSMRSKYGAKKLVVRVDGRDYVFAARGFSVTAMGPDGKTAPLFWGTNTDVEGIEWRGGLVGGGIIEIHASGLRLDPVAP